jgi:exodeoxyribonuclease-3
MRLATWNVNSVRARIDRVVSWLERSDIDVLAAQETKCRGDQFPTERLTALGYEVAHHGLSAWNGVALISRVGLEDVEIGFPDQPGWGEPRAAEPRAIGATCGGVRVWSLYVPSGRTLDDPHYVYWNIAPFDEDVWDMGVFTRSTHVSAPERAAFNAIVDAGYADVVRPHTPGPGVYTYWDYARLRFPRREGMRLDFALCSPALATRVVGAGIDRQERKGKGASDHAPVIVDLAEV